MAAKTFRAGKETLVVNFAFKDTANICFAFPGQYSWAAIEKVTVKKLKIQVTDENEFYGIDEGGNIFYYNPIYNVFFQKEACKGKQKLEYMPAVNVINQLQRAIDYHTPAKLEKATSLSDLLNINMEKEKQEESARKIFIDARHEVLEELRKCIVG